MILCSHSWIDPVLAKVIYSGKRLSIAPFPGPPQFEVCLGQCQNPFLYTFEMSKAVADDPNSLLSWHFEQSHSAMEDGPCHRDCVSVQCNVESSLSCDHRRTEHFCAGQKSCFAQILCSNSKRIVEKDENRVNLVTSSFFLAPFQAS